MDTELWKLSALELAAAVGRGEVSAAEVVDGHLERIAVVNPSVNAVTNLLSDSAREAAKETDRRRAGAEPLGRLAGAPFTVKENIDVAGSATTHGVLAFREAVAAVDAPAVQRLRQASAIPIGRANMPDLTLGGMHTASQLYGDTVNSWDPARTPGGSSGGDGVAVATGMAALGVGNDSGGSIRIPAAFCGVAGLTPGYGWLRTVPLRPPYRGARPVPLVPAVPRRRAAGAFGRRPARRLRDPRRHRPARPARGSGPALRTAAARPVRVGVVADPGGLGVHPDVRAAVKAAAGALEDAGYAIEEVDDVSRLADALDAYGRSSLRNLVRGGPSPWHGPPPGCDCAPVACGRGC